jgi:hypothetical protein
MKQIVFNAFFLIRILTGAATAQQLQLPAGLELPPHWDKLYEIVSYEKDGLLIYRNKLSGFTQMKQIVPPESPRRPSSYDTLYADTVYTYKVWEIDTSQYANMFRKMGEAPVNNWSYDMQLADTDGNTRTEIIGQFHPNDGSSFSPTYYYEWNPLSQTFEQVAECNPTPGTSVGISVLTGDIDDDSRNEVYYQRGHWIRSFESSDSSQYATEFRYRHEPFEGIIPSGHAMADFDLDNKKELAFIRVLDDSAGISRNGCIIRENLGCDTCFTETAAVLIPNSAGTTRFAVGDLNGNGKPEIFGGGMFGLLSAVESIADDSFSVIWQGQLPTFNADYHLVTNDLNNNGKPELWAGGGYGISVTRNLVTVFESDDLSGYLPVSAVEIQGGNGLYIWQIIAADFDGDNHDEVVIDVGGTVMMFQLNKRNEILLKWARFVEFDYGIGAGDVDGDGIDELVLAQNIRDGHTIITKSSVYKWMSPNAVHQIFENHNNEVVLKAFPNPFNASVSLAYQLSSHTYVTLNIFDVLGKKVTTLVNQPQSPGRYKPQWDGTDSRGKEVSSSVYFAVFSTPQYQKVQKLLLMH